MIYTLFCSCRKMRPFIINRLGTLCAGAKTSNPLFSVHCALFCKTGGWVPNTSAPSLAPAVICATWRLYPLWPHSVAHTSRHHGGVLPPENKITRTAGLRRDPVLRLAWPAANRLVHPPRRESQSTASWLATKSPDGYPPCRNHLHTPVPGTAACQSRPPPASSPAPPAGTASECATSLRPALVATRFHGRVLRRTPA